MFENDIVLKIIALPLIKPPQKPNKTLEIYKTLLFLINSLCSPPEFQEIRFFIKPIINLMEIHEICKECLEILLQISEFSQQKFVNLLIKEENFIAYLKFYLAFAQENVDLLDICLKIITNFTFGSSFFLLDSGIISLIIEIFGKNCGRNLEIQWKIIRILNNILQESKKIIQILLKTSFFVNSFKLLLLAN